MSKAKMLRAEMKKNDRIWATYIKQKFGNHCAFCGSTIKPNAAHIIPREIKQFRWDMDNGICLCPRHHRFSFEFSAHQNPFAFFLWFKLYHYQQYDLLERKWENYINGGTFRA